ncbi:hypothetical protein Tsubulata_043687, partial [Turnera subulata]
ISVINRISDFEALQNPTFLSPILALPSGIQKPHYPFNFWKWGAIILALFASVTTIVKRIKILIITLKNRSTEIISSSPLFGDEFDFDSDSETDSISSCSSSESGDDPEEEEEEEEEERSSLQRWRLRRRRNSSIGDLFSWPEFTTGKNTVVKLWDNLGLGLGINTNDDIDPREEVSVYDTSLARNVYSVIGEYCGGFGSAVSASSSPRAVVVSAEARPSGNFLRVFDTRVGRRMPEILAEWRPMLGRIVGVDVSGGGGCGGGVVEKVFVRDGVTGGLKVGDIRKAGSPLVDVTESDVETWWDADAVIVGDESVVD